MMNPTVPPTGSLHDLSILIRFFGMVNDAEVAKACIETCIAEREKAEELVAQARAESAAAVEIKRDAELAAEAAKQAAEQAARTEAQAQNALEALSFERSKRENEVIEHGKWLDETRRQIEKDKELAAARIKEADEKVAEVDRVLGELAKDREHWAGVNAEVEALKAELETKLAAIRAAAGV